MRKSPPIPREQVVISFGPALRLMSEDYFSREMGMSMLRFRNLCVVLGVPMIEIDNTRLLDPVQLIIALKAVTRLGQPNFYTPSSQSTHFGRRRPSKLTVRVIKKHLTEILAELLYTRDTLGLESMEQALTYAKRAAERLILSGISMLPAQEQALFEKKAVAAMKKTYGPSPEEILDAAKEETPRDPIFPDEEDEDEDEEFDADPPYRIPDAIPPLTHSQI